MASNRTKYLDEMREQTAVFILESGKSATSVAEEMGLDVNTVCKWVRVYRRKHNLPSYAEEKGIRSKSTAFQKNIIPFTSLQNQQMGI